MRLLVRPTGLHSTAMLRIAKALTRTAPLHVEIVDDRPDVVVSHVIGPDPPPSEPEIVIQYCLKSAGEPNLEKWAQRWDRARLTWSYYDLPQEVGRNGFKFYHAPLGVDAAFTWDFAERPRDLGVISSGYVSSPIGEAIEEVRLAAERAGIGHVHLGPPDVVGCSTPMARYLLNVSDERLAATYQRCLWVSGLRHVEGFEMPVIEGLCCGARPIVFDRPEMRHWYEGHAVFVPECHGEELVERLTEIFLRKPEPVSAEERRRVRDRFNWGTIMSGFWDRVGEVR